MHFLKNEGEIPKSAQENTIGTYVTRVKSAFLEERRTGVLRKIQTVRHHMGKRRLKQGG